ncbi:release factor glutamine methyltransferase [Methanolobus vulcani]|jgi:release factor glutamine methyltransferase|uniref:Release factor glutamine methyltransferase n=1 Tax=Methanolobus vulcani TaxID=38026 RepID=A0A7Z7B1J5_9EURY|nr:HemK2/MTQ2 family protein methyltransferase [Methanolobus vulcani]MDK2825715.1 release factor glutamine methyltransferase [Methanolobus sp.]MDK2947308.1 release factor glutamine methyltransferase [Methanolobus sp.]SDF81190.1 release factor glutamine methyltransferase [Methanolobus vulcani]
MVTIEHRNAKVKLAEQVYEPAEDSYLLADTALDLVKDCMSILEIGTGTGFVSAVLKANRNISLIATEISPIAAKCAKSNGIDVIRTDMFAGLIEKKQFDVVLFNPPYLPTSEDEKVPGWLNYAFDGGVDGRKDVEPFMQQVSNYLKPHGFILMLISSLTGIDEVIEKMRKYSFNAQVIASEKCSFEKLVIIMASATNNE